MWVNFYNTIVEINAKENLQLVRLNVQKNIISPFQFTGSLLEGVETILLLSRLVMDLSKLWLLKTQR